MLLNGFVLWKRTLALLLAALMAAPLCCCLVSLHAATSSSVDPSGLHSCCHAQKKTDSAANPAKKPCHCAQKQIKHAAAKDILAARAKENRHPSWPGALRPDHPIELHPHSYIQRLDS